MSWQRDQSVSAGLVAVEGTYADIRIGSLVQGSRRTLDDVWKITDMRSPDQYDHKTTPWFRAVNLSTGEEVSIPPKSAVYSCMFMVPEVSVDPEIAKPKLDRTALADHQPLSDQEAVDLLVTELGAVVEATKDHKTGIVACPPLEENGAKSPAYRSHLEFAHGLDLRNFDGDIVALVTLHGAQHSKNYTKPPSGHGFPHQHHYKDSRPHFGEIS